MEERSTDFICVFIGNFVRGSSEQLRAILNHVMQIRSCPWGTNYFFRQSMLFCDPVPCLWYHISEIKAGQKIVPLLFTQLPPLFVFVFVFLLVSHSVSHCINNDHLLFVYCHFVGVHNCFNLWLQVVPQIPQVHSHQKVTRETVRQLLLFQKLTLMGKKMLTCDFFSLLRETTRPSPQETRSGVSNWRTAPWVLLSEVFSCLPYIC